MGVTLKNLFEMSNPGGKSFEELIRDLNHYQSILKKNLKMLNTLSCVSSCEHHYCKPHLLEVENAKCLRVLRGINERLNASSTRVPQKPGAKFHMPLENTTVIPGFIP